MISPAVISAQGGVDYARLLNGLSGGAPIAHWRCADSAALLDEQPGARHGSFTGTVSVSTGLPAQSNQALVFDGGVQAVVPDDAGLHLAEGSLSGWIFFAFLPSGKSAVVSKDGIGNQIGDFSITIDNDGELQAQFQDGTAQHAITVPVVAERAYHFCATWGPFGFDYFVDGKHIARNGAFTAGWTNNNRPLWFMNAQWAATPAAGVLDEVALYDYVLSDADVIALSQQSAAPVAGPRSVTADESQTTIIDVAAVSRYVGRKADITITITHQGSHGTATVNAGNDIEFAAGAVDQSESDSLQFTISDANGTSLPATVSLTVNPTDGTLEYDWAPLASWIDGVALTSRDGNDVISLSRWTDPAAATTGASMPKEIFQVGGQTVARCCFNRAPTGHPSLEVNTQPNDDAPLVIQFRLYERFQGTPRHLRTVFEVKTCKMTDPTTYKGNGQGTTSGTYPDWNDTHSPVGNPGAGKYFIGMIAGQQGKGAGSANWWKDSADPIDRAGFRMSWQLDERALFPYSYHFDRSSEYGGGPTANSLGVTSNDPGIGGVWHRIEIEIRLTDPATVPDNARRTDPEIEPSHTGDGFFKCYMTKDIDGELGPPGARQLIDYRENMIFFPKFDDVGSDDNMHIIANLIGIWFNLVYGGAGGNAKNEGWAWIRRVQVYRYDSN